MPRCSLQSYRFRRLIAQRQYPLKVRGRNVLTRQKLQGSFNGDDQVQTVELERRPVQCLDRDSDGCTFRVTETLDWSVELARSGWPMHHGNSG